MDKSKSKKNVLTTSNGPTTRKREIYSAIFADIQNRIIRLRKQFINAFKRKQGPIKPQDFAVPKTKIQWNKGVMRQINQESFTISYLLKILIGYSLSCSIIKVRQNKQVIEIIWYYGCYVHLHQGATSSALPKAERTANLNNHLILGT